MLLLPGTGATQRQSCLREVWAPLELCVESVCVATVCSLVSRKGMKLEVRHSANTAYY